MNAFSRLAFWLCASLQYLYPHAFRREFGDEMRMVLWSAINSASSEGIGKVLKLCLREIGELPANLLVQYQTIFKKDGAMTNTNNSNAFTKLRPLDWLAAMLIFVLPQIGIGLNRLAFDLSLPEWVFNAQFFGFAGCFLAVLLWGIKCGLPQWSLGYVGFLVTLVTFYIQIWAILPLMFHTLLANIFASIPDMVYWVNVFYNGGSILWLWFTVQLLVILVAHLLGGWPRIRRDWTTLSFLCYGGIIFYIWLLFDEYQHEEPWLLAAFTSIAIGAWLYLRAPSSHQRILALISGATLAFWIVAIAKWNLVLLQNWPVDLAGERGYEAVSAVVSWVAIVIGLLMPAAIQWLPPQPELVDEKVIAPA